MKHTTMAAGLIIFLASSASILAQAWTPDRQSILHLESSIQSSAFPKGSYIGHPPAVSKYARFYAGYKEGGHRLIAGELVLPETISIAGKPAGIYMVRSQKEFPEIMDGGCAIVHLVYDMETDRMLSLTCNGRA